ncbi:hypothetical protein ACFSHT_09940 [Paraburkholderia silviterrae]|uniref:Uncharacterized protein n=1 Tax=Paraburkholderia silviterrae TaxID=2528715 RepID=A0A4R5MES5_9BURK|nr:hypothetical protein [Paraburkholderia silviterrae]TDG25283.1 hypothetical protein EYW47_05430 [Paraburkholderia silviterrae]
MNRRTFLHATGGALAAAACAARAATRPLDALQSTQPLPMPGPVRMAVYDPALARGRALARAAARMSVPAFAVGEDFGNDIGMLWHAQFARRFETRADTPVVALCALRASDRFVLERLAAPHRCIVLDVPQT